MTFDKTSREPKRVVETAGPGKYDVDKAMRATKSRSPSAMMSKSRSRPDGFAAKE